ncbi:MAG TPA: FAD-dependent monooxygenase [Burkholderiales bacterium]|jgi:2-polyprenyl-6-methoxyphenol hydroxylase-like FAD-dependent oxidoreductase
MHVAVIGAGAAGLLFSLLLKRRFPASRVEVFEQNPEGATYGFGVVFSDGALAFLERDQPELSRIIEAAMQRWPIQRIVHRGERVDVDGNGFSAIGRLALQEILQRLCRGADVRLCYGRSVSSLEELADADLVVGADGSNSLVREALATQFLPGIELLTNRFAWYGTAQPFDCLTLTFRKSEHGAFVAHHYRHSPSMSTFVVECSETTWRRAGLDRMSDAESRACCEGVFAADLGGHALVSNRSVWRQFPLIRNERWTARRSPSGHAVLLGDALRTVHFSIGSGTRLAFEDAIALERAFAECGDDVPRALEAFERARRPVVEKLLAAANASSYWYEHFPERMDQPPWQLAYDYMTRSGRMTEDRLRRVAPKFMAGVDAERSRS